MFRPSSSFFLTFVFDLACGFLFYDMAQIRNPYARDYGYYPDMNPYDYPNDPRLGGYDPRLGGRADPRRGSRARDAMLVGRGEVVMSGSFTARARCEYRDDIIIDDGVARPAQVEELRAITQYRRAMREYNVLVYGGGVRPGFTQVYGPGLPFESERRPSPRAPRPRPPCFCRVCNIIVTRERNL